MEITIILSSLIFCLSSVLPSCPKDKKLLRFITRFFADFLLLVCTSLEFKSRREIICINDPFLNFFSQRKDKNCCDYSCLLFNQAIETVVILAVI